jgi:hemerythrin
MTALPLATSPSVSVESLDAEHRVQLGLITALQQALEQGSERPVVDEILDQLVAYTNAHFMSEQLLMRLYAYPYYESHTQEHDHLIEQVQALQERYQARDLQMTLQTSAVLKEWLLSHIEGLDHGLRDYLSKQCAISSSLSGASASRP